MNSSHLDGDVGGIWKKFNRCKGKQYAQRQKVRGSMPGYGTTKG